MKDIAQCQHVQVTIAFRRAGTRLHPNVWMEEVCLACLEILDRKTLTRGERQAVNEKRS
jgi:hypothetical protein